MMTKQRQWTNMENSMREKKDILFLCQFFYPEHNSSATLPFDTAKYYAKEGYEVGALVGYPKEYSDSAVFAMHEKVDGVCINRVKYLQLARASKVGRLINYFSFTARALLKVGFLKKYRVTIVYSNPPILPIVPLIAKKLYGTKIVFVAYDVYPEVAFASKSLVPGSLISRTMEHINKELYKRADCVVALTNEMKDFLLANRSELDDDRVVTIANWAHEGKTEADEEAYNRFGYNKDQLIIAYFGNMGICQDVDTILNAAEALKKDEEVKFLIVGHGNKKALVEERVREKELTNVQVLDFLIGKDFEDAVAVSSCCIVSLAKGVKGTCAPSKYYSYLQGGHPVIAIAEKGSYLIDEVEKEEIGYGIEVGDVDSFVSAVRRLKGDTKALERMGQKALKIYREKYDYQIAMNKYGRMIKKVLEREGQKSE